MTHVKSFYGDSGTLKVTLNKQEKGTKFAVIIRKRNTKKSPWVILKYYSGMPKKKANSLFSRISKEF